MRREVADMQGVISLPRRNGELVFAEPWESRIFGLAISASEAGAYEWGEFRQRLIAEIGSWEAEHGRDHLEGGDWRYYGRWLASVERLLADKGLVSQEELARRMGELEREDDHRHDQQDREGAH
jgi:nitrile hydratase accessory protein